MLRNYLRIAWRNMMRNKAYTTINVLGLALGICSCIVIYLMTSYEFSFDHNYPDSDRTYRIVGNLQLSSGESMFLNSPEGMLGIGGIETQIPGFETKTAFYDYGGWIQVPTSGQQPKKFNNRLTSPGTWSPATIFTWPSYFSIFPHQWLLGTPSVLNEPFRLVLTLSRARQYFGDIPLAQMIGRTVIYDDSLRVSVAGIVDDWKGNSDFAYTDLLSISTATHSWKRQDIPTEDWNSLRPHRSMAFVKLAKGTTVAEVNERLARFVKAKMKTDMSGMLAGAHLQLYLQPFSDIHFSKDYHRTDDGDDFAKPYLPTLYALMGVALFILLIAVMNFINLSTAQSIQRAREIGVRKVMGGSWTHIFWQFLVETGCLTFLSVLIAVLLVRPVMHLFQEDIPEGVHFTLMQPATIAFVLLIWLVTTLLAGFYPARVLAGYLPVLSLKGAAFLQGTGRLNLRRALIVFQFTLSLLFIMGAMIIEKQIHFMAASDKGFNSEAVIVINHWRDQNGMIARFAQECRKIPGVRQAIVQANPPMGFGMGIVPLRLRVTDPPDQQIVFEGGDENYIPFYRIHLLAGRNLEHSDSLREFVINETYARTLGFHTPQDAIGKFLYLRNKSYPIVGVVADFRMASYHEAVRPAVIAHMPEQDVSVGLRLDPAIKTPDQVKAVMAGLEQDWKKIYTDMPFQFNFLNEAIGYMYAQEEHTNWLVKVATCITIFISCMGLFGLGMFSAERRTKEIGIRKVLGATVAQITVMLGRDFLLLILASVVVAVPLGWYCMHQWLQDYVYRTEISWWIFAVACLSALVLAAVTVSFQAIRAALANPVKSLRTE